MAITAILYDAFRAKLLAGADVIDFLSDDIRVALVTSAYTPDRAADDFWSIPQAHEVAAGGAYSTDGVSLTGITPGVDGTSHFAYIDADDVTWSSSTITARYAVVYKKASTAATSPLVGYIDFGADEVTTGADFKLVWAAPSAGAVVKV